MSFWLSFRDVSSKVSTIFGGYIFYSASFSGNVFYSFYICQTENKNWRLKVMIFTMMGIAASYIGTELCLQLGNRTAAVRIYAINNSFDNYVHWLFCYVYLKQQIEIKYLLDSRIYVANQEIIMQRNRENSCLEVANILNLLISVGLLIWQMWMTDLNSISLINMISTVVQWFYLVTWSYALCSLFARFKASEHLLPRKRVFIIHTVLLTVVLLCQIIELVLYEIYFGGNCDGTCKDICASIFYIT